MSPFDLEARYRAAETVTRQAGMLASEHYSRRTQLTVSHKGAQDLVSEADRACEEHIVAALSRAFPGDAFLGEESGQRNVGGEATWVIDPIDGTHNFVVGVRFWCVSVGLVVAGKSVIGHIYHPAEDELFSALDGRGAFLNGEPIKVSSETDVKKARLCVGFSYRAPIVDHVRTIDTLLTEGCEYLRIGSGALGLAYTAAGRFEGYWERHLNSWDAAAGLCLVREAGGWTNDFLAGDGLLKGKEMLAATPALVEPLSRLTGFAERSRGEPR